MDPSHPAAIISWLCMAVSAYILARSAVHWRRFGGAVWYAMWEGFLMISASIALRLASIHSDNTWLMTAGGLASAAGGLFLAMALLSLYRSLTASLARPPHEEPDLIREDIAAADVYCYIVNKIIARVSQLLGKNRVKSDVESHLRENPFFRDMNVGEDGRIDIRETVRKLERIDGKRGMPGLFRGFVNVALGALRLYSATVSDEDARHMFEEVFAEAADRYGPAAHRFGMPLVLFWKVLESPLRRCDRATIDEVRQRISEASGENPLLRAIEIRENGAVDVGLLYEALADIPGDEWANITISALSSALGTAYPAMKENLGGQLDELISSSVLSLIRQFPHLKRYGLIDVIPPGSSKEIIRMLRGGAYLLESSDTRVAFATFNELQKLEQRGLCITQVHPDDVTRKYGVRCETVWLSRQGVEGSISPQELDLIRDRVQGFAEEHGGGVVLLDGIEYMILMNGIGSVLTFLNDLKDIVTLENATLIVFVSPTALDEKHLAMLERSMEVVRA